MTDIELVFNFTLPIFNRTQEEEEIQKGFEFTVPEINLNPTEYTVETLLKYLLGIGGWQIFMFSDYWILGTF